MVKQKRWLVVGTVPYADFQLTESNYLLADDVIEFENKAVKNIHIRRGTPALLAAAYWTLHTLQQEPPTALLIGDTGSGVGSKILYSYLVERLTNNCDYQGITFHYLYPDVDAHNRILMALENHKPCLVADAGFMYAAKMSGYANYYDLFTPDVGELAFLADEKAPHPFYTRGFLLSLDLNISELVERAYAASNAAKWLIVKGMEDRIFCAGKDIEKIDTPNIPVMEAIGGTGDLITGVVTGLLAANFSMQEATILACKVCRLVGGLANPTPETQVTFLLPFIKDALATLLKK